VISVRTLVKTLKPAPLICDACRREVKRVRGSMWHGDDRICPECFIQWYDGDGGFDPCDRTQLGNHVRAKHGLLPLTDAEIQMFDKALIASTELLYELKV